MGPEGKPPRIKRPASLPGRKTRGKGKVVRAHKGREQCFGMWEGREASGGNGKFGVGQEWVLGRMG